MSLNEPYYMRSSLSNRLNSHYVRSFSLNPLIVHSFKKIYYGVRSFSYAVPFLWNHLPNVIRSAPTYTCFRKKS